MTYRLQNLLTHKPCIIQEGTWSVGRDQNVDFAIAEPSLSSFHATLINREDGLWIEDAQSTNGTRVQGELISEWTLLRVGDVVMMGDVAFLLLYDVLGDENPVTASPVPPPPSHTEVAKAVRAVNTVKLPVISLAEAKQEVKRLVEKSQSQMIMREQELADKHTTLPTAAMQPQLINRLSDTDRFNLNEAATSGPKVIAPPRVKLVQTPVAASTPAGIPMPRARMVQPTAVPVRNPNTETDGLGKPIAVAKAKVRNANTETDGLGKPVATPQVLVRASPIPFAKPALAPEPEKEGWGRFIIGLGAGLALGAAAGYWLALSYR